MEYGDHKKKAMTAGIFGAVVGLTVVGSLAFGALAAGSIWVVNRVRENVGK